MTRRVLTAEVAPMLPRRQLVRGSIASGLAVMTAPWVTVQSRVTAAPGRQPALSTFSVATNRTPSDLDPHSAYDAGSGMVLQGPFEGLIRLKPGTADEIVPVL